MLNKLFKTFLKHLLHHRRPFLVDFLESGHGLLGAIVPALNVRMFGYIELHRLYEPNSN